LLAREQGIVGPVTEIACHHNKVLATWHADTDEWTYQHRVARKRPTQKQSDQLAQMFDQASAATDDGMSRNNTRRTAVRPRRSPSTAP